MRSGDRGGLARSRALPRVVPRRARPRRCRLLAPSGDRVLPQVGQRGPTCRAAAGLRRRDRAVQHQRRGRAAGRGPRRRLLAARRRCRPAAYRPIRSGHRGGLAGRRRRGGPRRERALAAHPRLGGRVRRHRRAGRSAGHRRGREAPGPRRPGGCVGVVRRGPAAVDGHGHGTHVASTILGTGAPRTAGTGRRAGCGAGQRKVCDDSGQVCRSPR